MQGLCHFFRITDVYEQVFRYDRFYKIIDIIGAVYSGCRYVQPACIGIIINVKRNVPISVQRIQHILYGAPCIRAHAQNQLQNAGPPIAGCVVGFRHHVKDGFPLLQPIPFHGIDELFAEYVAQGAPGILKFGVFGLGYLLDITAVSRYRRQ